MTRRAKVLVLILLLMVWGGLMFWVLSDRSEPQRAPLKYVSGQVADREVVRSAGLPAPAAQPGLRVNLELLAANRQRAEKAVVSPKNIFAPLQTEEAAAKVAHATPRRIQPPMPPIANPGLPPMPSGPPGIPPPPPPPSPEEMAKQAARQELSQYRYLGYLSRSGRDEAFLSKGKDLHIVARGETIESRVLVKAITPNGVTLEEIPSHVEQVISLTF
jgi:hypothetical protein